MPVRGMAVPIACHREIATGSAIGSGQLVLLPQGIPTSKTGGRSERRRWFLVILFSARQVPEFSNLKIANFNESETESGGSSRFRHY